MPCNCFGEGKDVCNCKQSKSSRPFPTPAPPVSPIRPHKPIIKTICKEYETPAAPAFNPIGDICHCGQTIVKPAPYPLLRPCPVRLLNV